jgi:hypothetical protein
MPARPKKRTANPRPSLVEAIGRNSNLGHLCKEWADLRQRIKDLPARPPLSHHHGQKQCFKRFLTTQDVTDIVRRYEAGETTQQIGTHYGISKAHVALVLRNQAVTIRRQGLTAEQLTEAAEFYVAGHSLAWLGSRYMVSHTTVAAALRRRGIRLRPRPGWI